MAQPSVILYADAIDHLLYNMQGAAQDAEQRDIYQAIQTAYRELGNAHDWSYYLTHGRVTLAAPMDNTVGSYVAATGVITLGTAISAAQATTFAKGRVQIGTASYPLSDASDASETVTIETDYRPASLTAATAIVLYRSEYQLPADFRAMDHPIGQAAAYYTTYVKPQEWLVRERMGTGSGQTLRWTIMPDQDRPGGFVLVCDPYPSSATTLDFIYVRTPRRLFLTGYETNSRAGTVSSSTTTVTGSGTTFTGGITGAATNPEMIGAFVRYGDTTNIPTGIGGRYPYYDQRKISGITSTTILTIASAFDVAAPSTSKYVISDLVDISPTMQTAFLRACEWQLSLARGREVERSTSLYYQALRESIAADWRSRETMVAQPSHYREFISEFVDNSI